jgi:hypothetical protein
MTKADFLKQFANKSSAVHIRMALNYAAFLENPTIKIREEVISLRELLDFYVPKYEKHGKFDIQHYDIQAGDPEVLPLTIRQAMRDPAKWDLAIDSGDRVDLNQLGIVPIATDHKSGKTLLLDSNHTIVSSLHDLDQEQFKAVILSSLSVAHITGTGLENFIPDFRILNRV